MCHRSRVHAPGTLIITTGPTIHLDGESGSGTHDWTYRGPVIYNSASFEAAADSRATEPEGPGQGQSGMWEST